MMGFESIQCVQDRQFIFLNLTTFYILGSCSLGAAQNSLQLTRDYLKVRKQFGKTLDNFQVNLSVVY
jgi:alkylation response protein AidB-like acyl-CoA dehydrogenase